jgi:hypothetical protein
MEIPFSLVAGAYYVASLVAVSLACAAVPMLGVGLGLVFVQIRWRERLSPGFVAFLPLGVMLLGGCLLAMFGPGAVRTILAWILSLPSAKPPWPTV